MCELEAIKVEISKLSLKEDDILVIRVPHCMPNKYMPHIKDMLRKAHFKTLILSNIFDLGVLKKDTEPDEFESLFILPQ